MTRISVLIAAALAFAVVAPVSATTLNFEDAHSAHGLNDNDHVTNQYQGSNGITFSGAYLEHVGGADAAPQGFLNDTTGQFDDPFATASGVPGLGDWFLRTNGDISSGGRQNEFLEINYDTPVMGASGQIWDIDGHPGHTEQWEVQAFMGSTMVVSDLSPLGNDVGPGSLNGLPWEFSLSSSSGFDQIRFVFKGSKTSGIGLAFDNFNAMHAAHQVPEPSGLWLFVIGLGLLGAGLVARRVQRRA